MTTQTNRICRNCIYMDEDAKCHGSPPAPILVRLDESLPRQVIWPTVNGDWIACPAFKRKT